MMMKRCGTDGRDATRGSIDTTPGTAGAATARCRASCTAEVPGFDDIGRGAIGGIGAARSMADDGGRVGGAASRRTARSPRPRERPAARRATPRSGRSGVGSGVRQIRLAREPLAWHPSTAISSSASAPPKPARTKHAWPIANPPSSRSRRKCCSRPMPAASFPMAESADDPALYWIEPEMRGIIPLDRFHVPARLARTVRADRFRSPSTAISTACIDGCAEPQAGRAAHLDQCAHPHALSQAVRAPPLPQRRSL